MAHIVPTYNNGFFQSQTECGFMQEQGPTTPPPLEEPFSRSASSYFARAQLSLLR